jgi:hypothetical protein
MEFSQNSQGNLATTYPMDPEGYAYHARFSINRW